MGVLGEPGYRTPVVHGPSVQIAEVRANVAPAERLGGCELTVAWGVGVNVMCAEEEGVECLPLWAQFDRSKYNGLLAIIHAFEGIGRFSGPPTLIGRSTHVHGAPADGSRVKLFRRNDAAYAADAARRERQIGASRIRPLSRLNEQCAKLREVHVELDAIEERLISLREHQVAFLAKSAVSSKKLGRVETVDLRSLVDVDMTTSRLEEVVTEPSGDSEENDDFDQRFAAFAAGESDDMSRRWLDNA